MATNNKNSVSNYLKNLGNSVKYATVEKVKATAPAMSEFSSTNTTLFKEITDMAKDYRRTVTRAKTVIGKSKIYEAAEAGLRNISSDLRTGKFYNPERTNKTAMSAMGIDDFDFGDDFGFDDDFEPTGDSVYIGDMVETAVGKSTNAVCNLAVRTSKMMADTSRANTQLLYSQNVQMYSAMNKGFSDITNNTGALLNFANTAVKTHIDNSQLFYKTSTDLQMRSVELLEKIYESVETKPEKVQKNGYSNDLNYSSITSGGVPDLREYAKLINKNIKNMKSSSMLGMVDSMGDNGYLSLVSSPLSFIPNTIANKLIGKAAEQSLKSMNDTFGGLFATMLMRLKTDANKSSNPILGKLAEVLGINNSLKSYDTSKYEKGAIHFNGKTQKAITEVIPKYLAEIAAALTGKTASVYDYDAGKFVGIDDLKKRIDEKQSMYARSSTSDMRSEFNNSMRQINFESTGQQKALEKDIDNFFKTIFEKGMMFDFNDKNIMGQYKKYGVSNPQNFAIIRNMFMNSPRGLQMMFNHNIMSGRDNYNSMITNSDLSNVELMMYNDSNLDKYVGKRTTYTSNNKEKIYDDKSNNFLTMATDNKGHNVFWYLENILVTMKNNGGYSNTSSGNYVVPDARTEMRNTQSAERARQDQELANRNQTESNRTDINAIQRISFADAQNTNVMRTNTTTRREQELNLARRSERNGVITSWLGVDANEEGITTGSFKDRMKNADSFGKKMVVFNDMITDILSKPSQFLAKGIDIADKRLYTIMYGDKIKTEDGREVSGILGLMTSKIKTTFQHITDDIKEFFGENKDNIKAFFEDVLHIDLDAAKGKVKNTLFGVKDADGNITKKGLFTNAIQGTKEVFNDFTGFMKKSLAFAYAPILKELQSKGLVSRKVKSIDDVAEGSLSTIMAQLDLHASDDERANLGSKSLYDKVKMYSGLNRDDIGADNKAAAMSYVRKHKKQTDAIIKQFGPMLKKIGADDREIEGFARDIQNKYSNEDLIKLMNGMNAGNFARQMSIEDMFGAVATDNDGKKIHSGGGVVTSQSLINKFNKGLKNSDISGIVGTDEYSMTDILHMDIQPEIAQINTHMEDLSEAADEITQTITETQNISVRNNNNVIGKLDRIINLLSKIAKEPIAPISNVTDSGIILPGSNASGARYVTKSGITAISKGEMIIPSDKNPFNPNRNRVNRRAEIANENRIRKSFLNNVQINADGTPMTPEEAQYAAEFATNDGSTPTTRENINEGIENAAIRLGQSLNTAVESITGLPPSSDLSKSFQNVVKDAIANSGKYGKRMLGGGIVGGLGATILTGGLISPMLGAAIGAGAGLLSSSDQFQDFMFGTRDENGTLKTEGLLPKGVSDWIHRKGKKASMFGMAGSLTGLALGHPLIGLLAGSAIGVAESSEKFQNFMFGDNGVLSKERRNKIFKALPMIGLAGLGVNALLPGAGLLTTAALSTIGGLAASTKQFQEFFLGRKDPRTGKYEHGLLPAIRNTVLTPLGKFMQTFFDKSKAFLYKQVADPLRAAFTPIGRMGKFIGEGFKSVFSALGTRIGDGIWKSMNNVVKPIFDKVMNNGVVKQIINGFKISGKILGTVFNPLKWLGLGGKVLGNFMGKAGMMENMSEEQYNKTFGIFGKTMKRKGDKTRAAVGNAIQSGVMSRDQVMSLMTDVNMIKNTKVAEQRKSEADRNISNTLNDIVGGAGKNQNGESYFNIFKNIATSQDLSSEQGKATYDKAILDLYGHKWSTQDRYKANKDKDDYESRIRAELQGGASHITNSLAQGKIIDIFRKTSTFDEAMTEVRARGYTIAATQLPKLHGMYDKYRDANAIASRTDKDWNDMTKDEQLEAMKNDKSFRENDMYDALNKNSQEYRSATNALTNKKEKIKELQDRMKDLGINPAGMSVNRMLEILESEVKSYDKQGLWGDDNIIHSDTSAEAGPSEETEAINGMSEVYKSQTDKLIELVTGIANNVRPESRGDIDNRYNSYLNAIATGNKPMKSFDMAADGLDRDSEEYSELSNYADRNGNKLRRKNKRLGRKINTKSAWRLTGRLGGNTTMDSVDNTDVETHAYGGYFDNDHLAVLSKDELIVDTDMYGNKKKTKNPDFLKYIPGYANGNLMESIGLSDDQKEKLDKDNKKQDEKSNKFIEAIENVDKNTKLTRESLAPDADVKKNKGKAPGILSKFGDFFKGKFNFKKLFTKAKMMVVGAGIVLSPLLGKLLDGVVPLLTDKLFPAINKALPGILDNIMKLVPGLMNIIVETLPKFATTLVTNTLPAVLELLPKLVGSAGGLVASITEAVPKILKPLLDTIPALVKTLVTDVIPTALKEAPKLLMVIADSLIGDVLPELMSGIMDLNMMLMENLPEILYATLKGIVKGAAKLVLKLFNKSADMANAVWADTPYEVKKIDIPGLTSASGKGKGKGFSLSSMMENKSGKGILDFFRNLGGKNKVKSAVKDVDLNINKYSNGKSYQNGRQVNPDMAHISQKWATYKSTPFKYPFEKSKATLSSDGCGIMSAAMVANGLLGEDKVDPKDIASDALLKGYKSSEGGLKSGYFKELFTKLGIDTKYHDMADNKYDISKSNILNSLANKKPVILLGKDSEDTKKSPFGKENHYVVATGLTEDGNSIVLNDPYSEVGGDVYSINDVLNKTTLGIEASIRNKGLSEISTEYTKTKEAYVAQILSKNNAANTSTAMASVSTKAYTTNNPTVNIGKAFDPIAYQDLGTYNPITKEEFEGWLKGYYGINQTPFYGNADIFLEAARKSGLDPRYILAHAATESAWGTSAIAKKKGNYFGITAYNGSEMESATDFGTGLKSIISGAEWIKRNFYNAGQKTLYDMIYADPNHRYAALDNAGTPNDYWISTIASIMRKAPNAYTNLSEASGKGGETPAGGMHSGRNRTKSNSEVADIMNAEYNEQIQNSIKDKEYISPFIAGYYDSLDKVKSMYKAGDYDSNTLLMRSLYGNRYYELDLSKQKDNERNADADSITNIMKVAYAKKLLNDKTAKTQEEADKMVNDKFNNSWYDIQGLINNIKAYNGGTVMPTLWSSLDQQNGGVSMMQRNPLEYTLLNEILYNPSLLENDYAINQLVNDYGQLVGDPDGVQKYIDNIKKNGYQMSDLQTRQVYKSPAIGIIDNKVKFGPFGSSLFFKSDSQMKKFNSIIKPNMTAFKALEEEDKKNYELYHSNYMANAADAVIGSSTSDMSLFKDAASQSEAAIQAIASNYETNGTALPASDASAVSDEAGSKTILDIIRGIGEYFSEIFNKIGEKIFGINENDNNNEPGGSASAHETSNKYGVYESLKQSLILKRRPDSFGDINKSSVLKAYTTQNIPNASSSKGWWSLNVYGKDSSGRYLLLDGTKISIPNSYIVSGTENVPDIDATNKMIVKDDNKIMKTIQVKNRPDKYGEADLSTVLSNYTNRNVPDNLSNGSWNLKVYGTDGKGNYKLADGTIIKISDSDIINKALANVPVISGINSDSISIGSYASSSDTASDSYFTKSLPSYVSSTYGVDGSRYHSGIDYATGGQNPKIYSPISGTVVRDTPGDGTGNYLIIKEDGNTDGKTRYHRFMHMKDTPLVREGDYVTAGQGIGFVGSTGNSSGEHLHYDIADETGLGGSGGKGLSFIKEHYADPNKYLAQYFSRTGYKTENPIYNNTSASASSNSSAAKGGDNNSLTEKIESLLETLIGHASRISDNTSLISRIADFLGELKNIEDDTKMTTEQKHSATVSARKKLNDDISSSILPLFNKAKGQSTGNQSLVQQMQLIARD